MSKVKFTKMQGLGNDFILFEPKEFEKCFSEEEKNSPTAQAELAKKLCDRNFGIGADGIFVPVLKEDDTLPNKGGQKGEIGWIFLQSDGSTSQMCGNGMRCFAKFVYDKKLIQKKKFAVGTGAGIIIPEILEDGTVKVNMNKPVLEPSKIPFKGESNMGQKIEACGKEFSVNAISMGNPHCVIFSNGDINAEAFDFGEEIERHPDFPQKTNVEFVKVISRDEINVAVWERGCGITLACGTGACASAVAAILSGQCDDTVNVNLPGGSLIIEWAGNSQNPDSDVFMTGSADYVFKGSFTIK